MDSDGLYLLILPSAGRYWQMNYRYLCKYRTLAFGVWPEVELADARAKRYDARRILAKGSILPNNQSWTGSPSVPPLPTRSGLWLTNGSED